MTFEQVKKYFQDKRDTPCDITKGLVNSGFQQKSNTGYLKIANVSGLKNPSQWWHLMQYCLVKEEQHMEKNNYPYTPCGELIFWMAEVSGSVDKQELKDLATKIIKEPNNRELWNAEIKKLCWENLNKKICKANSAQQTPSF
ncbi:MAG: hypothetical protein ABF868_12220 [Sporolactobacillus sp.]